MPGPDAFKDPFGQSMGKTQVQAAIGFGRARPSAHHQTDGHHQQADGHHHQVDGVSPTGTGVNSVKTSQKHSAIRIRRLPKTTTKESLRNMMLFARDSIGGELVPSCVVEQAYATAVVHFKTTDGATNARDALDGKPAGDDMPEMVVEIVDMPPGGSSSSRPQADGHSPDGGAPRSRFSETFQKMDRRSPPGRSGRGDVDGMADGVSPTFRHARPNGQDSQFSPQTQIGQPLERQRVSGRSVIQEDGIDDDTNRIMNDPEGALTAEQQHLMMGQGRRATVPNISLGSRFAGLSINSSVGSRTSPPASSGHSMTSPYGIHSPGGGLFSPPGLAAQYGGYPNHTSPMSPYGSGYLPRTQLPPANPADQNPPCNTLYVGNLPIDTSEDELKALFCKQRGYKRLCFRTKANGPMCFVEFEDVSLAGRALNELYGTMLSNSVRGGIRLSFSKNPLGVRTQGLPGGLVGSMSSGLNSAGTNGAGVGGATGFGGLVGSGYSRQSFSTASGPPPGLPPPNSFPDPRVRGDVFGGGRDPRGGW